MGLDLSLLPFDYDGGAEGFSHTLLNCVRRDALFGEMMKRLRTHPVPEHFATFRSRDDKYEESHYGNTQTDAYGSPLEWAYAEDLLQLAEHEGVADNRKNRAVWAYLKELPPKTKVALYWR